jgi:protein-S-isoprenylcysteine O-methyltransferase Ste14
MSALRLAISVAWLVFWAYWLISATTAKAGTLVGRSRPPGLIVIVAAIVLLRVFKGDALAVHSDVLIAIGTALLLAGLGVAVWARLSLGRNWGMPMSQKDEPELVTSGPYRFVRHPIYSGILLALLGTALATNLYWFIVLGVIGAYFIHSARVEERLMTASFPAAYASYRANTKMLVPFVL